MAIDKAVDSAALDSALTDIANAIRAKTGGTDPLTLEQMPGEIEGIESGGGEIDHTVEDAIITRSISGAYENNRITTVGKYAFIACRTLISANLSNCTELQDYAFSTCAWLTSINAPKLTTLGVGVFNGSGLLTFNGPLVTSIRDSCFQGAQSLTAVTLPLITTVPSGCLRSCTKLERVDLGAATSIVRTAFTDSTALETLIIRTETLCTIADASVTLRGSKIAAGTGYIYVPDDLVDSYKAETNWVVFADQIKGLSELEASE
ncbi:MAG: leucine-rich repeat protein [Acutalibacteraceae bacterium]